MVLAVYSTHAADQAVKTPVKSSTTTTTTIAGSRAPNKTPAAVPVKPEPEAALLLPKLIRRSEAVFIVYRHGGSGFMRSNGFDTLVYGFNGTSSGTLTEAIVSERKLEGLTVSRVFSFVRAGEEIFISISSEGMSAEYAVARTVPTGVEVRGDGWTRSYAKSPKGVVSVQTEAVGQTVTEEWKSTGKESFKVTEGGVVTASGGYSLPEKGKIAYTEHCKDDTSALPDMTTSLWVDKDEARSRTEGAELVCEVYAAGLGTALTNDCALENLALIDTVLGREQRILPILVWMNLRFKGGK